MIPDEDVSVHPLAEPIMVILLQLEGSGSLQQIWREWRFLGSLDLLSHPPDRRSITNCIQRHQLGHKNEDGEYTSVFESAPFQIHNDAPLLVPYAASSQIWRLREEYFDIAKEYRKDHLGPTLPCSRCRSFPYVRDLRRSNPYLCPNTQNYRIISPFGPSGEAGDIQRANERDRLWSERVLTCPHFSNSQEGASPNP